MLDLRRSIALGRAGRLGAVAAGTVAAVMLLALAEGALRLLGLPDLGLYEGDAASVWWLRPDLNRDVAHSARGTTFHVRTNVLGLRGPMPPDSGRWTLALGCSTTFGWGVEDEQAWPAILASLSGEPVVNGGQPGWSTHQAVAGAGRFLRLKPSRVILAFIVRDAQAAAAPDSAARPLPWLRRLHIARAVGALRRSLTGPEPDPALVPAASPERSRVPPEAFERNLRKLIAMSSPAETILLVFPQRTAAREWVEAMKRVGPALEPALAEGAFFADDPVHLNPGGHRLLAEYLWRNL